MLKTNFTYCSIAVGRFYRNCKTVKKLCRSGKKHTGKKLASYCKNLLSHATAPMLKASAVAGIAIALSVTASAQCDTFYNADAANPIHIKGLPKSREPYFVDIDGDGDYDCYVLDYFYSYATPFFYKNIGTAQLPLYKYEPDASGFSGGDLNFASTNTAFVDIDGDGDYDCFIAQAYTGNGGVHIKYFENTGTATHPVFVENEAKNPLGGNYGYGFYSINFTFADIDGDGDLDCYVYNDYSTKLLINKGTKTQPAFVEVSSSRDANQGDRAYYDWNGDGLLDYFNMDFFYGFHYYKNIGPKSNPSYVIDDAHGPHFLNDVPHQFTDLNGDGAPEVFNRYGGFSTLAAVPVVTTANTTVGGKTYTKLTVSPTGSAFTFQWYYNGVAVARATSPSIVAFKGGIYSATIIDSCGTGVSLPVRVAYPPTLIAGEEDKISAPALSALSSVTAKAYPNPFTSQVTIQLPQTKSATVSVVRLMDASGKIWLSETTSASSVIVGKTLPAGAYIVQVLQANMVVYKTILVKQ